MVRYADQLRANEEFALGGDGERWLLLLLLLPTLDWQWLINCRLTSTAARKRIFVVSGDHLLSNAALLLDRVEYVSTEEQLRKALNKLKP